MKRNQHIVLLVAVSICLPLIATPWLATNGAERRKVAQFSSYSMFDSAQRKRYDFEIYEDDLARTPAWPSNEEFPPLSPRKAETAARDQLRKLVEQPEKWSRRAIELRPMSDGDKWVYVVHFNGFHPPGVLDGAVPQMRLIVLMDGRAIEPKISVRKTPLITNP